MRSKMPYDVSKWARDGLLRERIQESAVELLQIWGHDEQWAEEFVDKVWAIIYAYYRLEAGEPDGSSGIIEDN